MAKKIASASTTGAASACSEADLQAAAVVMWGAEGLLGAVELQHFDIGVAVTEFPVAVQDVSAIRATSGEENGNDGWDCARQLLSNHDRYEKPYLRIYGRVMEILLNHRGFQTCSAGDVFWAFLAEIPGQLEENHRQSPRPGGDFDLTMQPARRTFNNRMKKLRVLDFVEPTVTRGSGRKDKYVLTKHGQKLFDGWPDLNDIPGLELDGPVTPENARRRRS